MKLISGGVCAAKGYKANGIHCGIRKNRTKNDLALIVSEKRAAAAAVYTTNLVKGAPLTVTKKHISDGYASAVICNSGNANTCNANGIEVAEKMSSLLADALDICPCDVVVASTGVIGQPLDITPIANGIPTLIDGLSVEGGAAAAEGITDTYTVSIKDKVFDWRNMVREIYSDLQHSAGKDVISARFMNTIIHMAVSICREIREEKGLNRVCLSGGTFQNMYILNRLPKVLEESGFEVYTHRRVSCNDEGLSLGQIAILNEVYNVSGNSIKTY